MDDKVAICPLDFALPISVIPVATSFCIEGPEAVFNLLPRINNLPEFGNYFAWSTLQEGFDYAIIDPTIFRDTLVIPEDICQSLVEGIYNTAVSIVLIVPLILLLLLDLLGRQLSS